MEILARIEKICASCGKSLGNKDVKLVDEKKELAKEHYCKSCKAILDYNVRKYGL